MANLMRSLPFILTILAAIVILGYIGHAVAAEDCGCSDDGGWGSDTTYDSDTGGGGSDTGGGSGDSGSGDSGSGSSGSQDSSGGTGYDSGGSSSSDSGSSSVSAGTSSENGLIWGKKGDDYYTKGLYNESLEAYQKAAASDPYALKTWIGLGKVYLELGDPFNASVSYKKAIKLDPSDPDLHVLLGDAHAANSSYADAITSYRKALTMKPGFPGVSEKIALAEAGVTGMNPVNATPTTQQLTTVPTTLQATSPPVTGTVPVGAESTPHAAFPGVIAVMAIGFIGFIIQSRRK